MKPILEKLLYHPQLSKMGRKIFFSSIYTILIIYYLWCIPAIYFLNLPWEWLRLTIMWIYIIAVPLALIIFRKNKHSLWPIAGVSLFFGIWFSLIPPSNNKNWEISVAKQPRVKFDGNLVHITNIRSFIYKTPDEFKTRYISGTYNLDNIDSADYILSYWDGNTKVAHSMLSFGFKDGRHICVSVETRREKNEPQTGLRGLYNQYELIYILADESDLLLLRTNYRKEEVYVYPLKPAKPENIRKVFVEILKQVKKLETHPTFYNTIKHNCFTTLMQDIKRVTSNPSYFDYRVIFNGLSDQMGYEKGWFKTDGLPFDKFKELHHINKYIQNDPNPYINFSQKIRPKLNNIKEK